MKKLRFAIMAAGLVAIAGTMNSCKKESPTMTHSSQTQNIRSTARELTPAEAEVIVQKSNAFVQYADAYLLSPSAQIPGSLPTTFNDAAAITYLENGYNFTYSRPDIELVRTKTDEYTVTINKNASGQIALQDLVQAYKMGFDHIKSVFDAIPFSESNKRLHTVDVSLVSTSASTLALKLYSIYIFDRVPFTGTFSAITYSSSDEYYIDEHPPVGTPGKKGDASVKFGAPYQIRMAVAANFPFSFGIPKSAPGRYLAVNIEPAGGYVGGVYLKKLLSHGDYNYFLTSDATVPTKYEKINIAADNPWHLRVSCAQNHDPFLFGDVDYLTCPGVWVPGDALNYSVNGFTEVLKQREILTGKSLWQFGFGLEKKWPDPSTNKGSYFSWTPDIYVDVIDPSKLGGGPSDSAPGGGLDLY